MRKANAWFLFSALICFRTATPTLAADLQVTGNLAVSGSGQFGPAPYTAYPSLFQIFGQPGVEYNTFVVASQNGGEEGGLVIKPEVAPGVAGIQGTSSDLVHGASLIINAEGGNLGVGTATPPNATLQVGPTVTGNAANPSILQVNAAPGANALVVASSNGGQDGALVIKANYAAGTAAIQGADSGLTTTADLAINAEGGKVGIGTATPNATLQVNGGIGLGSGSVQANRLLCWTNHGTIGYCSGGPDRHGVCNCNEID